MLRLRKANIGADKDNFHIDGYIVIPDAGKESETKMSRTAMVIRADRTYRVRKDLSKLEVPKLWIEIWESRRRKMLIGGYIGNLED